jgi:hypothetical protein
MTICSAAAAAAFVCEVTKNLFSGGDIFHQLRSFEQFLTNHGQLVPAQHIQNQQLKPLA